MDQQNDSKSTITPHNFLSQPHEFIAASILTGDGLYERKAAVSLSDLRQVLDDIAISDYLAYEARLRDEFAKRLAEVRSQVEFDSVVREYEETEQYKKGRAEFMLVRDLNETLFRCRERLMKMTNAG